MYNYVSDVNEDFKNKKANPIINGASKNTVRLISALSFIISLLAAGLLNIVALISVFAFMLIGILYSVKSLGIKKIFFVKNLSIGMAWFFLFLFINAGFNLSLSPEVFVIAIFFAILSFIGSIVRDMVDVIGDSQVGIKTIPIVLKVDGTANLFLILTILQFSLFAIFAFSNIISYFFLFLLLVLPLRLLMIYFSYKQKLNLVGFYSLISYLLSALILLLLAVI